MRDRYDHEFDRQRDTLLAGGYPALARISPAEFAGLVEPLREAVRSATAGREAGPSASRPPFILVVSAALIPADELVPRLTLAGGTAPGVVDRNHGPEGLDPYQPLPELGVPDAPVYALIDVDRGEEFLGVRPADAVRTLLRRRRSPLTIHEGIALVAQFPGALEKNRCFMLAGSRRGDRRVPALWISGNAPKLGWCWEGNPHTWLGTASAAARTA